MKTIVPEVALCALKELGNETPHDVHHIDDESRMYLHSGLAIALTYYEQYIHPVCEGYRRVFYYFSKSEFPHAFIFTHVDTVIAHG
ncbi:hypothetical protein BIZ78_gp076 [Erwinia phage vB_EamM_Caitlin]|uniref:hypothetical protein n=1 Tax=Erwinia phage vB_EamM_Caitlin TaxID=1883379 RepID=UPI00081C31B6|nr:hypothetical protein BIZ78_gp076 [Erwinia phage vB_EamM_Caitlin]ANZ48499.1 hypothetical protein CAITLIN_204 [Erwinia phage vB_EamM_Caitlin]